MKLTWKFFWCYMAFTCVMAYRLLAQNIPYVDADSIKVVSNSLNNFAGALTNDPNSNVNAQTVFDAIDNMMLPTSTNIVINTNNFTVIAPTNNILQTTLDWIDDNWHTNISNTNIYMTGEQTTNSFPSWTGASNAFISSSGGQVSNKHMAANSVTSSNIPNGAITYQDLDTNYVKTLRVAGFSQSSADNATCSSCGSGGFTLIGTTRVQRVTDLNFYMLFDPGAIVSSGVNIVRAMYANVWVSSNGTSWSQVQASLAKSTYATGVLSFLNDATAASVSYRVPQGCYYWINGVPGHTNSTGIDLVVDWQLTVNEPDGP